ncbi:histamine H2 receptor [Toxorhynchites rutilus septentrionalis]|uniref:histamine H2 receptor n=1 Tax=Toxorhynchites rutilus septentrionalis TaxID=329112 RepID=UPI00247AFDE0|nr:histamine H2 receptor [Toxorhynchites rutilus septentrionalis]
MDPEATETTTIPAFTDRFSAISKDLSIWAIIDGVLIVCILCGNILTILAVRYHRRLRLLISNMFVLSLAFSDIFVGLTLPYHLAFYMGHELGRDKRLCLLRFFILIIACGVSIWNLIAIAVDRYIAICYPLHYARVMTKKVAFVILSCGWCLAILIATIPLVWNKWETAMECEFDELLHPWYVAGVITPIFSIIWICLFLVYWRIWREAVKHAKQLRAHNSQEETSDWKSVQVVLLIMGCFTFCWLPYFVVILTQINTIFEHSSPTAYKAVFSLAMANSMMNPLIYAWKNTNFRYAFSQLLRCRKPDRFDENPRAKMSNKKKIRRKRDVDNRVRRTMNGNSSHINKISIESVTQGHDHEITFISTLHEEAINSTPIQQVVGNLSNGRNNTSTEPTSITTHIIKGNLIINNYNVYEGILDVRNDSTRKSSSWSSKGPLDKTDEGEYRAGDVNRNKTNHNCDNDEIAGISNPSFLEDVTKL